MVHPVATQYRRQGSLEMPRLDRIGVAVRHQGTKYPCINCGHMWLATQPGVHNVATTLCLSGCHENVSLQGNHRRLYPLNSNSDPLKACPAVLQALTGLQMDALNCTAQTPYGGVVVSPLALAKHDFRDVARFSCFSSALPSAEAACCKRVQVWSIV